jgi:hypothetical protein
LGLLAVVLIIPACGKSGGFGAAPPPSQKPVAIVPETKKVLVSTASVSLDGSKSYDPVVGAPPLSFLWVQTAGTPVTLSSVTIAVPTFTAPAAPGNLSFQLTVTGAQGTDSASITLSVQKFILTVPDQWFVGYGNGPTVISPSLSGSTSSPVYTWSGMPAWGTWTVGGGTPPTLTYSTPPLTDFQNFQDIPGVAVLERTTQGRVQLTLSVTDGVLADQAVVNFSVGPFPGTVANENVAFGNPVFLNGAATVSGSPITAWVWSGTKPDGSVMTTAADFKTPNKAALGGATNQQFVYFVPNKLGTYQIQVSQSPGPAVQVITINCGKYVGIGNQTGTTPDPFVGNCAACHAGQLPFVPDFANPWLATQHSQVFQQMLDPTNILYGPSQAKGVWRDAFDFVPPPGPLTPQQLRTFEFSIDSRVVGFSQIDSGGAGGWAASAAGEGFVLAGATWPETIRKNPQTAALSNTQCESCHGPGSEHAGDTAGIRKSFDSLVCGRCHAEKQDVWDVSAHADRTSAAFVDASGSASCNGCHTAQGFVVEMNAQQNAAPHPVLYAISNPNRPVIAFNDRRTQTCPTCHDPHQNTVGLGGANPDPQLRSFGNVQFRNGATVNAGRAAVCYMCHQSRTDTRDNSPDMNVRRAPHDSTAAEMISGTNGIQFAGWTYNGSPHGIDSRFVSPSGENRHCLACHNDVQPQRGSPGFGALGGHSFNVVQGVPGGVFATQANYNPLGPGATLAGSRKFTVSGGPSLLKQIFPGDALQITAGADSGATVYTVTSVDSASQITLGTTPPSAFSFTGGGVTGFTLTTVPKYNTAACLQCHPTAPNLQDSARADYDGDTSIDSVQAEISGLLNLLATQINTQLAVLLGNSNYNFAVASGRITYTLIAVPPPPAAQVFYTFPGPGVTSSQNPQISWSALTGAQQAQWLALYKAAYNWAFVTNDRSGGIHNTGYAVNLLQSSIKAINPAATLGSPFVPFP